MNSKERMIRAINHIEPDRVPLGSVGFYDWSTPYFENVLLPYFGLDRVQPESERTETLLRRLEVDFRRVNIDPPADFMRRAAYDSRFHRPWGVQIAPETLVDEWGVTRVLNATKTASRVVVHPLKDIDAFENYVVPDPDAEGRYDSIEQAVKRWGGDYAISCGLGTEYLFTQGWFLRGFNEIIRDFYVTPSFIDKIFDRMQKYYLGVAKHAADLGVTIIGAGDDVATQRGMTLPPNLWRKFIKPRLKELVDTIKKRGVYAYYHSDGMLQAIIPDLIEIGVDILNPVQPECMDPVEIKRQFGDKITLNGTISMQKTLSQGTVENVKNEVILRIRTCGHGGGFILSLSNNLTLDVPVENYLAVYETAKKYGKYPINI